MPQKPAGVIRQRRRDLGLTLVTLSARCASEGVPVHHSQLSKIERGLHPPRPQLRALLARLLELEGAVFDGPPQPGAAT
ncbi:helix-turn-helix domain-containing protein [Streptomyces sp. NPDC058612]|uniref:helix-turn-helix domain-containing protein n=1 Tax=Streptomyces sp. NPDC058612 TaxID=3346555 RepID=UPI003664E461